MWEPGQRLTRSARYLLWVLTARAPPAEWRTTLQDRTLGPAWLGQGTIASRPPWGPGRAPALITSLAGAGWGPCHLRDSGAALAATVRHGSSEVSTGSVGKSLRGYESNGTRKCRPKRAEKARNSEERASQKPRPSSGRRRTGVAMTRTNAGPAESSSARYGPDPQPLRVSSILFTGHEGRGCIVHHLPLR